MPFKAAARGTAASGGAAPHSGRRSIAIHRQSRSASPMPAARSAAPRVIGVPIRDVVVGYRVALRGEPRGFQTLERK